MTPKTSDPTKNGIDSFIEFEKENDLFSLSIKGHPFWSYIRYVFYQQHLISFTPDHVRTLTRKLSRLFGEIPRYLRVFATAPFRTKKRYDLVIVNDGTRKSLIDGKYVNPYTYPLIKELHRDYKILLIDDVEFHESAEGDYPVDFLNWRPFRFLDRLLSSCVRYSRLDHALFSKLGAAFSRKFGIKADVTGLAKGFYAQKLKEFKRYDRLFKCVKPRLLLFVDNGTRHALIEAARQNNIGSIELQHSVISDLNVYCNYPDGIDRRIAVVPDHVFTYGTYWNGRFRSPAKTIATGFPYMDHQVSKLGKSEKKPAIIIISGSYSKKEFVETTIRLATLLPDHTVYYKLKFTDFDGWQERYPRAFTEMKNICVIDNERHSLYEYLSQCTYQIGVNSGGLYEGLYFDLVTFILKTGFYEESSPLYENGCAFLVSNAEEIAEKIKNRERPANQPGKEQMYKPDSLGNMRREMESLMGPSF